MERTEYYSNRQVKPCVSHTIDLNELRKIRHLVPVTGIGQQGRLIIRDEHIMKFSPERSQPLTVIIALTCGDVR